MRSTRFSGTRARRLETGVRKICMMVPKLGKGRFVALFVTERKCSEAALLEEVQEAYINGSLHAQDRRAGQGIGSGVLIGEPCLRNQQGVAAFRS